MTLRIGLLARAARVSLCAAALALVAGCGEAGQQDAASGGAAQAGETPTVLVDAAHGNYHTIDGRFGAFAELLGANGYRVAGSDAAITAETLGDADIFVISNAVKGGADAEWALPTPPALEPDEIEALLAWVEEGGSLLLIADHMPFPGSVAPLADALGVVFLNGYALADHDRGGQLVFSGEDGSLLDHPITAGVPFLKTYTGQGFRLLDEAGATPLMALPDDWEVYLPVRAGVRMTERTPFVPARGLHQGAVLERGAGRVAIFGEAAMFTAQAFRTQNGEVVRIGLNDPEAPHNDEFVLNVMAWLSGDLDE